MMRVAAAQTMPAAPVRECPRARSRSTKGAKTAEITTATAIDAVTVHRTEHTYATTITSPAIAMTRQPRAARLTSQSGTKGAGAITGAVSGRPGPPRDELPRSAPVSLVDS